ncbi:MAG: hypothetical protein GX640_11215 [Fibrobacter sp.]|nr:hypothetical protein [Fibrobacter sp.]
MAITNQIQRFYTLRGKKINDVYVKNRMGVHNQGHYLSVSSPQTIAKQGTLTLSMVLSPSGTVSGLIDAGSLIFLNDNPLQLASIPFVRIDDGDACMLTSFEIDSLRNPDDFPLPENYYYPTVEQKNVSLSIATPLAELRYRLEKTEITRRIVSSLLSKTEQFLPASVEEYEITNRSNSPQTVTVVIPMPSLVNIVRKISRPREQDYTFLGSCAVTGHIHETFTRDGIKGIRMGSSFCDDRMVIAVPERDDLLIDLQEAFRLRNYNQDLVINSDGRFHHANPIIDGNDYGAAISVTVTIAARATVTFPVAKVLDFPMQKYSDNVSIPRRYTVDFPDVSTRDQLMAVTALRNYSEWLKRTIKIQENILFSLGLSSTYRDDKDGAIMISRLLFNELSYLLSNASVLDTKGQARFLECFDYPFNNSADVDFYSKLLLAVFPEIELDLCKKFVDSINDKDDELRFYHSYISDPVSQQHYLKELQDSGREIGSDIHIYAAKKSEGAVYHDLGSLTFGNPLRDKSEYTWYNTSYWIDLFPKLALRVLRDAKYTGKIDFITENWETLKKGFNYLISLDFDGDGIPEGRAGEVRNTYDNIPFAGVDVYDANLFVACLLAMIRMAEITGDIAEKERFEKMLGTAQATYDKLWYETTGKDGQPMAYYITCTGVQGEGRNTDVFTDQLVGLWQWIAMGEKPFLPQERVVKLLKTIFVNNRTPMGWATARKEDGSSVESDQGKDVWIASNYVLAQMLDFYGLESESKEVYRMMDKIIFDHGNSLNTAESVRPEYEKQVGEKVAGPHYIVASYPRPGAIYDILFLNAIKREWDLNPDSSFIESEKLQVIRSEIFNPQ